jgi:hypothetical protein
MKVQEQLKMSETGASTQPHDPRSPRGHTRATVELHGDPQLTGKLKRTEAKFGIETGVRFKDDGQFIVSVSFYPEPKFFIQKMNKDNTLHEAEVLEQEEYEQTWALRL